MTKHTNKPDLSGLFIDRAPAHREGSAGRGDMGLVGVNRAVMYELINYLKANGNNPKLLDSLLLPVIKAEVTTGPLQRINISAGRLAEIRTNKLLDALQDAAEAAPEALKFTQETIEDFVVNRNLLGGDHGQPR